MKNDPTYKFLVLAILAGVIAAIVEPAPKVALTAETSLAAQTAPAPSSSATE